MRTKIILCMAIAQLALLGACGGDTVVNQGTTTISKGQELTDLQRALSEGAITQDEYDKLRSRVMRRPS